jgi:hypothetical protein
VKAEIVLHQSSAVLELVPENIEDQRVIKALGDMTRAGKQRFGCVGFEYLKPEVKFVVSGPPRSSD